VAVLYPRTREAFVRKYQAEAELREVAAQRGRVALEHDELRLQKERISLALDLMERTGDPNLREAVFARLRTAIYQLTAPGDDVTEGRANARRLLLEERLRAGKADSTS
jgi:hypothetical protein